MCLAKFSILLQYAQIFVPTRKGILYRIAQAFIVQNILLYFICIIVEINGWVRYLESGLSIPTNNLAVRFLILQFQVTAGLNVASDIVLLLLPLVSISRLQMTRRRKMGLMIVFAAGFLSVVQHLFTIANSYRLTIKYLPCECYTPYLQRSHKQAER